MAGKLSIIFAIAGTVIGPGLLSGKELVVFFSRFGLWSYLGIFCLLFFFYFLFKFLLGLSSKTVEKILSSRLFLLLNCVVYVIFSSAMFASLQESLRISTPFKIIVFFVIFALCSVVLKKGVKTFGRLSNFLVPISTIVFIFLLVANLKFDLSFSNAILPFPALFYSLLYCTLNASNSCVLVASLGQKLSQKEKARVAFFAALLLVLILFFANTVLLENQDSLTLAMPFLTILHSWQKTALELLIFLGSLTTLFSLVCNFHILLGKRKGFSLFFFSIILPFALSFAGFDFIVTFLEPVASAISLLLLAIMLKENFSNKALSNGGNL